MLVINLVCLSCKKAVVDRKPVSSTEQICELCSRIVRTMVPVVANPLVGLDPVLKDGKVEFKGYFHGYRESFQDHDAGATMGTHCHCTKEIRKEEVGSKGRSMNGWGNMGLIAWTMRLFCRGMQIFTKNSPWCCCITCSIVLLLAASTI